MEAEAKRVGMEHTQRMYQNTDPLVSPYDIIQNLMVGIESGAIVSCLGGLMEGVVLKHHKFQGDKGVVSTKLKCVAQRFKERHAQKQGPKKN